MRRAGELNDARRRPGRALDALGQLSLVALAYLGYALVRGLVGGGAARPFRDATRIIDLERGLHVFVEPRVQAWVGAHAHWLLVLADWTYLNAHVAVTAAALAVLYARHPEAFRPARNALLVAMAIALVGYALYPTAPPRLMPVWGFVDSIRRFTGVDAEHGVPGLLLNPYAAVPSMHVCFAVMTAGAMRRCVAHPLARALWRLYPPWIAAVVVITGNHYLTDVALGALTAMLGARLAGEVRGRSLARVPALAGRRSAWADSASQSMN